MRHQSIKSKLYKKPIFYCDEDFPEPSLEKLKNFKVKHCVLDFNYQGRDDDFHYQFAAGLKAVLLTLDDDYLDNQRFKLNKTFGVIVIQAGRFPTWDRVNLVIDKLMIVLKSLNDQSLKSVKINASLEGYTKWILKNNSIKKEEFNWKKLNVSRRHV